MWWTYKSIKQMEREKLILSLPKVKNLDQEVWALTKAGFYIAVMGRDDFQQFRYRVHAPAHDYLGTCLQLGDLWQSRVDVQFFTEQQLNCLAKSNFPWRISKYDHDGHVPDGVTQINGPVGKALVAYEVDLNLKSEERYNDTFKYYREILKPKWIIWLVKNRHMANRINGIVHDYSPGGKELAETIRYVMLDEFKAKVWAAQTICSKKELYGVSVRKIHENLVQSLSKGRAKLGQSVDSKLFFPKYRSPQKLDTYMKEEENAVA